MHNPTMRMLTLTQTQNPNPNTLTLNTNDAEHSDRSPIDKLAQNWKTRAVRRHADPLWVHLTMSADFGIDS